MKIYYAHCVSIFDTPQEERDVKLLEGLGFEVHNPNNKLDAEGYLQLGMEYFRELIASVPAVAFRASPGGLILAGVYKEVMWARQNGALIIELPSSLLQRGLDVNATREYLNEIGQR